MGNWPALLELANSRASSLSFLFEYWLILEDPWCFLFKVILCYISLPLSAWKMGMFSAVFRGEGELPSAWYEESGNVNTVWGGGARLLCLFWRDAHRCVLLSGEVGNAAKMMLIVNMVQGSFMATIAEGLTLAQVTGQSQQTLLDILNQGQLASIFLDQKCQSKVLLHCFIIGHLLQASSISDNGKSETIPVPSSSAWDLGCFKHSGDEELSSFPSPS